MDNKEPIPRTEQCQERPTMQYSVVREAEMRRMFFVRRCELQTEVEDMWVGAAHVP